MCGMCDVCIQGLAKELTEAMSAIELLRKTGALSAEQKSTVLFDVCSGKGITATLLALQYPEMTIHMVTADC